MTIPDLRAAPNTNTTTAPAPANAAAAAAAQPPDGNTPATAATAPAAPAAARWAWPFRRVLAAALQLPYTEMEVRLFLNHPCFAAVFWLLSHPRHSRTLRCMPFLLGILLSVYPRM